MIGIAIIVAVTATVIWILSTGYGADGDGS